MTNGIVKSFVINSIVHCICAYSIIGHTQPTLELPNKSLHATQIGIIVNTADKLSQQIGEYYRLQRRIPSENLVYVNFKPGSTTMSVADFRRINSQVEASIPSAVQALVLTWLKPYRVTCMSITSAFAFGFSIDYCAQGCKKTKSSPYFNSASRAPYQDFGIRPTIVLAGDNFDAVKKLISRGLAADKSAPTGTAYLLDTNDKNRNVRSLFYDHAKKIAENVIKVERIKGQALRNKKDVLFYFTGLSQVSSIETNHFLAGAIADHLTSTGGQLTDSTQMSIMQWIKAGVTGSYGTVVEPCNLLQKFPNPSVVMDRYISGETLIEAYWKSVKMPGQGIFVGEPLARPFGGYKIINKAGEKFIRVWSLSRGKYFIWGSYSLDGPYQKLGQFQVELSGQQDIKFSTNMDRPFLYFREVIAGKMTF